MAIIYGLENVAVGGRSALTLGAFDGVHRGHQALVRRTLAVARERELSSVVLTFDPDPDRFLRPEQATRLLSTTEERLRLLASLGPDLVVVARFDAKLAATEAQAFVREVLMEWLGASHLVVGPTLTFGHRGAGNADRLREWANELGLEVEVVPAILIGGRPATSSAIRELLTAGDVAGAREMLGRPYSLGGTVERGKGRGQRLGFPTANLVPDPARLAPADGVYAVVAEADGTSYEGVASIGGRPTFPGSGWALEVHLPGLDAELYGRRLDIQFWARLRGQITFETPEALAAQMALDVHHAQAALAALHRPAHLVE
jgi:riboflavin kinase/FMN adenylyltransferase